MITLVVMTSDVIMTVLMMRRPVVSVAVSEDIIAVEVGMAHIVVVVVGVRKMHILILQAMIVVENEAAVYIKRARLYHKSSSAA
jgi:hypothetical protein